MYLLHFTEGQFPAFLDASKEARLLFFGLFVSAFLGAAVFLSSTCLLLIYIILMTVHKMLLGFLVRSIGSCRMGSTFFISIRPESFFLFFLVM